jgi:hypothetical protein
MNQPATTDTDAHRLVQTVMDLLRPSKGLVLEIGFGDGTYTNALATCRPSYHTIIEPNSLRAEQARAWSYSHPHITIIEAQWQNALPLLKTFDTIFLNEQALSPVGDIAQYRETSHLVLKQGKELLSMVHTTFPHLKSLRYSDDDLDLFYEQTGQFYQRDVAYFFYELRSQEQISEDQYQNAIEKYRLKKEHSVKTIHSAQPLDPTFDILDACLTHHMLAGSRFCCLCSGPSSKYEQAQFFERIITNPDLNYEERLITTDREMLIFCVEKCV